MAIRTLIRTKALLLSIDSEGDSYADRLVIEHEPDEQPMQVARESEEVQNVLAARDARFVGLYTQDQLRHLTALMEIDSENVIEAEWSDTVEENKPEDDEDKE